MAAYSASGVLGLKATSSAVELPATTTWSAPTFLSWKVFNPIFFRATRITTFAATRSFTCKGQSNSTSDASSPRALVVPNILRMNSGNGGTSYATNSAVQRTGIAQVQPVLEDALTKMYNVCFPDHLVIADMGCSSGPNTLFFISQIVDIIVKLCHQNSRKVPELQVFLNDLPQNDFNSIFRSLATFHDNLKKEKGEKLGPCFVFGVPGSFFGSSYGRLFPRHSLHFVHSSYALQWLSQV